MSAVTNALHRYRTLRRRSVWAEILPAVTAGVVLVVVFVMVLA